MWTIRSSYFAKRTWVTQIQTSMTFYKAFVSKSRLIKTMCRTSREKKAMNFSVNFQAYNRYVLRDNYSTSIYVCAICVYISFKFCYSSDESTFIAGYKSAADRCSFLIVSFFARNKKKIRQNDALWRQTSISTKQFVEGWGIDCNWRSEKFSEIAASEG